jgi:hypothetical protein
MKASLHTGRIACGLHFGCGNHAASAAQRQAALPAHFPLSGMSHL